MPLDTQKLCAVAHFTLISLGLFVIPLLVSAHLHGLALMRGEWWPSISAVIGDDMPERRICMIFTAASALFLGAPLVHLYRTASSATFFTHFSKIWLAGLFIFITSKDSRAFHETIAGFYILFSMLSRHLLLSQTNYATARKWLLWASTVLVAIGARYFFVHKSDSAIVGAYSVYSVVEWVFGILDVTSDFLLYYQPISDLETAKKVVIEETETDPVQVPESKQQSPKQESYWIRVLYSLLCWHIMGKLMSSTWFFPLIKLDLTGWEVSLIAYCSPWFIYMGVFKRMSPETLFLGTLPYILLFDIEHEGLRIASVLIASFSSLLALFHLMKHKTFAETSVLSLICMTTMRLGFLSFTPALRNILALFILWSAWYHPRSETNSIRFSNNWTTGIVLACSSFMLLWLFSSHGVISRWVGLNPYPLGILVVIVMLVSLMSDLSFFWTFLLQIIGATCFLTFSGGCGFIGGLVLAFSCVQVYLKIHNEPVQFGSRVGLSFGITMIALMLSTIWPVAYNYVPFGGSIFRERAYITFVIAIAPTAIWLSTKSIIKKNKIDWQKIVTLALLVLIISVSLREQSQHKQYTLSYDVLSVGVSNTHFGYTDFGGSNLDRLRMVMKDLNMDVVALLESDTARVFTGNEDIVEYLQHHLGYDYAEYGIPTIGCTWGAAIISRYPIIASKYFTLPSPEGELAPAVSVTINKGGVEFVFVTAHFGNTEDELDRKLQTDALIKYLKSIRSHRVIFAGYLTTNMTDYTYKQMTSVLHDVDPSDEDRYCQYMFSNVQGSRLSCAKYWPQIISDTEIQVGRFAIDDSPVPEDDYAFISPTYFSGGGYYQRVVYFPKD